MLVTKKRSTCSNRKISNCVDEWKRLCGVLQCQLQLSSRKNIVEVIRDLDFRRIFSRKPSNHQSITIKS